MASPPPDLRRDLALRSAAALVVANIIGAGIFTTTGFQAADLGHPLIILGLWVLGGVLALCGALCYAELGAAMPHAGAEYVYLRETYGRALAFMSAFVSLIAGFSAPIAAALKGFVKYAAHFVPALSDNQSALGFVSNGTLASLALAWLLVLIHFRGVRFGAGFNDLVTLFKVCGIAAIILAAAAIGKGDARHLLETTSVYRDSTWPGFFGASATSLIFVMFCYSGWNAAAYMAGEMRNVQRNLPRALLAGTGLVAVLYVALNLVYFYGAGPGELAGKAEVGLVVAQNLFGSTGVALVSGVLCISILASASAMTMAGPRVYYAFGRDFPALGFLAAAREKSGAPAAALLLQGVVTSLLIVSGRIDQIQQYAGFTLNLFASLAVSCVLVLRFTQPTLERPFKTWGYPWTPLFFLTVSAWISIWAFLGRPLESFLGLFTVLLGGALFYLHSKSRA